MVGVEKRLVGVSLACTGVSVRICCHGLAVGGETSDRDGSIPVSHEDVLALLFVPSRSQFFSGVFPILAPRYE